MSAAEVTQDTKLTDLTDAQRAELGAKLRDEEQALQPLLGQQEPIDELEREYQDGDEGFVRSIRWLKEEAGFIGFRRARRDGSCFYRCFAFAFIQKILLFNDRPLHHFITKHLESTLEMLKSVGFEEEVYLEFFNPLKTLLARIHSTDPEVVELDESGLISAFNDEETSNSIVVFLRLVVSAYLKQNKGEFEPFLFSLDEDFSNGGPPTMESFCANQVEAMGKEADHLQITALTRCLKVSLDVAYLSRGLAPPETPSYESENPGLSVPGTAAKDHPDRCDIVSFEVEGGQMLDLNQTLLLRPGHYDLLISAPPVASPEVEIPRMNFPPRS